MRVGRAKARPARSFLGSRKKLIVTTRIGLFSALLLIGVVSSCSKGSGSANVPAVEAGEVAAALSEDGHVTVAANQVTRQKALKELARAAGFELVVKPIDRTEETTVRLEGVPVPDAVEKLAAGDPYFLSYKFDAEKAQHVLETVAVGEQQDSRAIHLKRRRVRRAFIERRKKELLKQQREQGAQGEPGAPDEKGAQGEQGAQGAPPVAAPAETPAAPPS